MEALRPRAAELLRTYGPAILDLVQEMAAVETAVNATFGATPADWEARFAGTGLDFPGGVLGQLADLANELGDVEAWHAAFAEVSS